MIKKSFKASATVAEVYSLAAYTFTSLVNKSDTTIAVVLALFDGGDIDTLSMHTAALGRGSAFSDLIRSINSESFYSLIQPK